MRRVSLCLFLLAACGPAPDADLGGVPVDADDVDIETRAQPLVTWNPNVAEADCLTAWGNDGDALSHCDRVKDDYIVIRKSARNLALCRKGALISAHRVGLGFEPVGDKRVEGDGRTPEGVFYAARRLPKATYHKALLVSYPDVEDAEWGVTQGLISTARKNAIEKAQKSCGVPPQTTALGGQIQVHGRGSSADWTLGCVAGDNATLDVVFAKLGVRDSIVIYP